MQWTYNDCTLNLRRRHLRECSHRSGLYLKCKCPLWAVGTVSGKFLRKSLDTRNLERGRDLLLELEKSGTPQMSLKEAMERFIAVKRQRRQSEDTVRKFERLRDELVEYFGNRSLEGISSDELDQFWEPWKLGVATIRKKLERLRSCFKFFHERGWIRLNPAKMLKGPKEVAIEKKPFEKDELEKIAWAIPLFHKNRDPAQLRAFIAILRWTGLRIRDVVQLRKSQIHNEHVTLRTHKNQKPVKLPLHVEVRDALAALKVPGEFYFWSGLGNPKSCVGDWQRTLRCLSDIAGVHIHAHRWRHTFATDLLSKGVPVSEVAAILGNSPRIVEKHYSHWIKARQDSLDSRVKEAWA